jgi:hypothetical protein
MKITKSNSRIIILIATGVLAGAGLVYLIVRYLDKLIEFAEAIKKHACVKLEIKTPELESLDHDQNTSEAFYPGYDTEFSPEGTPQPNDPTNE